MQQNTNEISKFLSYILRHKPETIDVTLDNEGWVEIDILINQAQIHGKILDGKLIDYIAANSDKKRFTISENGLKIRAAQGHSIKELNINYQEVMPPEFLYHGTATRFLDSIKQKGLLPISRQYVHLSPNISSAKIIGQRHGKPIILKIPSLEMHQKGYKFYLSENGIWLTKEVPVEFLMCD